MNESKNLNEVFNVLSMKEEAKLSDEEKKEYYCKLREFLLNRKLQVTTKGALTIAPKLKKVTEKIARKVTKTLAGGVVTVTVEGTENIPDSSVIFACIHQGMLDNFVWIPECPKHALIVHGSDTSKFLLSAQLNTGLIMVERNSGSEQRTQAKLDMMSILLKGHSIFIFPESTWNLSPNKIHLPLNWGFVDAASKTGAPIIPIVINYVYDLDSKKQKIECINIKYGQPIYVNENDDYIEKLNEYSENISTMIWEQLEKKDVIKRKSITNTYYINHIKSCLDALKLAKKNIECERNAIYGANNDFYVFNHINDVSFDDYGTLLQTEECERLKKINLLHGI